MVYLFVKLLRNPAIANLTLVVIGSCAPEILLNLIEAVQKCQDGSSTLNTKDPKLEYIGPSLIIGSAAFNIFINSAIAIYAPTKEKDQMENRDLTVERGVKRVFYLGHQLIVILFNFIFYFWLIVILSVISKDIIKVWEALVTLGLYIPLLTLTYGYDKLREKRQKRKLANQDDIMPSDDAIQAIQQDLKNKDNSSQKRMSSSKRKSFFHKSGEIKGAGKDNIEKIIKYSALDFYQTLVDEKKGAPLKNYDEQRKRKEMKEFLIKNLQTDNIELVNYQELKRVLEGDQLISRLKYREGFSKLLNVRRELVNRYSSNGQLIQHEANDQKEHPLFGFKCLSYSVNEAKGSIDIEILNKKKSQGTLAVRTINGTAKAPDDYQKVDKTIKFKKDQESTFISIIIQDNEEWEPDEEFFVELYDPKTGYALKGKDCKCSVTIIDDDNPGTLGFEKSEVRVLASEPFAIVTITRKNGCKGTISCKYKTIVIEDKENRAIQGQDYEKTDGSVEFKNSEITQNIKIKILNKRHIDPDEFGMMFGLKIFDPQPKGQVKISMKDTCLVKIDLDNEFQLRQERLDQFLWSIERLANRTWESQFKNAIMLHPTLNLDGTVEDVTNTEALIHFLTIGWKTLLAFIPPPHIWRGWPALFASLIIIGLQMLLILEFSQLFGCVTNLGSYLTSLTVVSVGTSIPDIIATWKAASYSKYADNSLVGLQCSVSVNVALGLGISWIIQSICGTINDTSTYINSEMIVFQILIFLVFYFVGMMILFIRRKILGGELGGNKRTWKLISTLIFTFMWVMFIVSNALYVKYQKNN